MKEIKKTDRKCKDNATLKRISSSIVAVEKICSVYTMCVCVCVCVRACACVQPEVCSMRSVCNVLYCHLWLDRLFPIFPHYLTNVKIFGGRGGSY